MPRHPRRPAAGVVYHVLNRGNLRAALFTRPADYAAFEHILAEALKRFPGVDLFAYCLMPNHWHLLLRARRRGPDVSDFLRWLTVTHTQRWRARTHTAGEGHLYQGRFKSFPVQDDAHFLTACRYVERNPLRAGLADRAQDWPHSSLSRRTPGTTDDHPALADWPVARPAGWPATVNRPMRPADEAALRESIRRGRPFGTEPWQRQTARRLGLDHTFRPRGRPRKPTPTQS
jgi:putative transposase